ncbi:MAG TPA: hypothetical protein VNV66_19755 [Pilimelia sp.]|nr:hypothetical protein [Pilimelia sp.]
MVDRQHSIADLVVAAVARDYRAKDWMYAPLARAVDRPDLRRRLCGMLDAGHPLVRLRVQFVLHVLDHPEIRVRRHTWQRWLATDDGHG